MDRINSSKKGSKAERALAKYLTSWVGVEFQRVPRSGGLRWGSGLMVTGDIIPADPRWLVRFPFSIESKSRKSVVFQDLILDQNSEIAGFWNQSKDDAARVNKIPIVFFRYDFFKKGLYYVIVSYEVFKAIKPSMRSKNKAMKFFIVSNKIAIFTSNFLFDVPYLEIEESLKPLYSA